MAERTADGRPTISTLHRKWYVLAAAAVLGAGLGVVYAVLVPVQVSSRSLVLLSGGGAGGDGATTGIATQVQIVKSTPVLARAGRSVLPALSATQVLEQITVEAATPQLIQIDAASPNSHQAQDLSQAVAEAYVTTLTESARSVTGAIIGDLQSRNDALTAQLKNLAGQLAQTNRRVEVEGVKSAAGVRDSQLRAQLTATQSDLALQLDKVKSELAASGAITGASTLASIVQPAAPATGPGRIVGLLTWGLAGALLAAAFATLIVLTRARRDPRLRARDDMADAVGSMVLADVRSRPQRSVAEWSALFETYVASPVDAWAFRQLLRALAASAETVRLSGPRRVGGRLDHPRSLTLIALGGDRRGLAVAPQLAVFAASLGISTRFVLATGHDAAASLWAACSAERPVQLRPGLHLEARAEVNAAVPAPLGPSITSFAELLAGAPAPSGDSVEAGQHAPAAMATISSSAGDDHDADSAADEDVEPLPATAEPVPLTALDVVGTGPSFVIAPRPEAVNGTTVSPKHSAPELTIVLAVVDGRKPTLEGLPPTAVTVLTIAPGVGSREDLARLAVAVDDAERRIEGVVVADPDPSDRTTGRRTLDERARQAPLPVRITGAGQAPASIRERG